uniref:Uncharacterized protein n=1 Tax=Spongospora subterranea TaxID=70186 RepID=A0A0H5RE59_9EUKA|eukprot:CRZ12278.1 hypothetical protein [Spongospora subterranea]
MSSTVLARKEISFVYLSLATGTVLLAVDVMDFVATGSYRVPRITPFAWRQNLVMGHAISFYFFLAGFFYSSEARIHKLVQLSWVSFAINIVAFVLRQVYDIYYRDYHPAEYVT